MPLNNFFMYNILNLTNMFPLVCENRKINTYIIYIPLIMELLVSVNFVCAIRQTNAHTFNCMCKQAN